MKNRKFPSFARVGMSLLVVAFVGLAGTSAFADAVATIQPNAAGDRYIVTIQWCDLVNTPGQGGFVHTSNIGAGGSELDNPATGFVNSPYAIPSGDFAGAEVRYNNQTGPTANTAGFVFWDGTDPTTLTDPSSSGPSDTGKWDDLGDFLGINVSNVFYGSGVGDIVALASHNGVVDDDFTEAGVYFDDDQGGALDDLGIMLPVSDISTVTEGMVIISAPLVGGAAFTDYFTLGVFTNNPDITLTIINDDTYVPDTIVKAVPTPAALPAGLALIGLVAARRRRRC